MVVVVDMQRERERETNKERPRRQSETGHKIQKAEDRRGKKERKDRERQSKEERTCARLQPVINGACLSATQLSRPPPRSTCQVLLPAQFPAWRARAIAQLGGQCHARYYAVTMTSMIFVSVS